MKKTLFMVALLSLSFLFSCQQKQTGTSNQENAGNVVEIGPVEWNFDLLWKSFMAIPEKDLPSSLVNNEENVAYVRDETRIMYGAQIDGNFLYVLIEDPDDPYYPYGYSMTGFQYGNTNKLLMLYSGSDDGSFEKSFEKAYDYDMDKGTMTEVAYPFKDLHMKDFFDALTLADISDSRVAELDAKGKVNATLMEETDDAENNLLVFYTWPEELDIADRENRLVYHWDGKEFVHTPEEDLLGYTILVDGFCSLDFGTPIPTQLEGFDIERQTYMAEGSEQVKYAIKKDGRLVMEIEPDYDFEKDEFTNTISVINIYSDRYQTYGEFHVGSLISDVMDTYADDAVTFLTPDDFIVVDIGDIQFILDQDAFDGTLPEVTSAEGEILENPTFKPDARVKAIRLY